jgi:hypothetical protein
VKRDFSEGRREKGEERRVILEKGEELFQRREKGEE